MSKKHIAPQLDLPGTQAAFNLAGETGGGCARCSGCGCVEHIPEGFNLCRDCQREHNAIIARMDEPKSWQEQLAIMENNPDCI